MKFIFSKEAPYFPKALSQDWATDAIEGTDFKTGTGQEDRQWTRRQAASWENSNFIYFGFFFNFRNYRFWSVLVYFDPFLLYSWSREPYNRVDGYAGIQCPPIKSKFYQNNVTKQRFPRFHIF